MPPDERMLLERVTEHVLLGPNRSPSSEMSARLSLHMQGGACYWPASEINRPQLLLGQQERRKHHRDQRPKKKKLGHFGFSTSKLRSNGPANCVWAAIRARPAIRVGAGDARPAGNPRSAYCWRLARQNAFGQQSAFHQQNSNNAPPARRLPTSKRTYHQQTDVPQASAFPERP